MEKKVYQIGNDGLLIGETVLDKSDIDPKKGGWLIPAGCIETPPPLQKEGHSLYWNGMEWMQIPASKQDRSAERARQSRNALLDETDWTQLPDVPKATRDKWKKYRQSLRDLPQAEGWPNIEWPAVPE